MNVARLRHTFVMVLGVCAATTIAAQGPSPQPESIEGAVTHVYKSIGTTQLRLHIFDRSGASVRPRPAIVFFFGGGWTTGRVSQFVPQAEHLADRGMVAAVADYRVIGRHKTTAFEAMTDAKSAIRWLRAHAGELGIDANRIAAGGGSAGGHIALSAAVFTAFDEAGENSKISSRPSALVLFNPVVDTTHDRPVFKERFAGRTRDASPIHHLPRGLPPIVILHGKADTTVPYADVERFCVEASKLGNRCELHGYEGAAHGFFNPEREEGKWYRQTLEEMERFLTKLGYLTESSSALLDPTDRRDGR